ncbi:MAG: hypothetical protein JO097_15610 [Acidobacteriaceae bacterium]|nr:hypothetical protein [Acidobacteriaceae bacterium]MBV9763387.1 hypothetical protein [Acidobacteriaceae bacterium]
MHNRSVFCRVAALFLVAAAPPLSLAVDTHVWEQSDQAEFARGTPKNVSIRSDGRVTLAPEFKELDSTNVPYLWAIAQDSKGALYYAGGAPTGATAKVFVLPRNGKPKVVAEITGLEIHALAIDSQDRVYAAVLPDAKIYRIDKSGKPQLFFDPKCKYVWAMAFDHSGNLFVATGDSGLIYRVSPDGKGSKFFDTEETHARSMIIDDAGNLIVGTEPSGLVMRITPKGESFVLYQTNKREVTSVAEHDGLIYAASVGSKAVSVSVTGPAPVLPSPTAPVTPTGAPHAGTTPPSLPPAVGSLSAAVPGGSDFYRIQKDGFAERIWNSSSDLIYAIGFDSSGRPLLGTGNKGVVYRIDSDQLSTQLLNAPPTQVTAFLQGKNGMVYAASGNVGNLYSIGPNLENTGTIESEVLDANEFAHWGKAHIRSSLNGGMIALDTRSGNLNNPENNWSPWAKVSLGDLGGQIESPPARFLQYRLTLTRSHGGDSPELSTVDIAYLPRNIAPRIHEIEIAPFNYRQAPSTASLERSVMASGSPATLTLPAIGQKRSSSSSTLSEASSSATLQYSKGYVTVRWSASDPNNDPLIYKVEIRDKNDSLWRTLKDKLQDHYYSFDSTAFPDGRYIVRVTASDAPGNTPADTLTCSLQSEPFTIDNTPPELTVISITKDGPLRVVRFSAKDALSWIDKAEYSIDGGEWTLLEPVNKVTDSKMLEYQASGQAGQIVSVRVFDEDDNVVVKQFALN